MDLVKQEKLFAQACSRKAVNESDVWLFSKHPSTAYFPEEFRLIRGMLLQFLKCLSVFPGEIIDANENTGYHQHTNYCQLMTGCQN